MSVQSVLAKANEVLALQGLSGEGLDENEARRFLTALNMDVDVAAGALARKIRALQSLPGELKANPIDFEMLRKLLPVYWVRDANRCAMFAYMTKDFDAKSLLNYVSFGPSGKLFFQWLGFAISKKCEISHQPLILVIDMAGVTLGQTTTSEFQLLIKTGASVLLSLFPDRLKRVYCINAPNNISIIQYALKKYIPVSTLGKIVMVESAMQLPANEIPQELIPRALGGTQKTEWTVADSIYKDVQLNLERHHHHHRTHAQAKERAGAQTDNADRDDLESLLRTLEISVAKAEECERIHLLENARLRRKISLLQSTIETNTLVDKEELELRRELQETLSERDAYRRAVLFARNYIEQEVKEREEFTLDIEAEIDKKRRENLALVDALKDAFGSDAPSFFT